YTVAGWFGPKLKAVINAHKLKVMPLITNDHFNQILMHSLLISDEAQAKVISQLVQLAKSQGYIGWQFDFEHIKSDDKDLYTGFVQKSYKEFKNNQLELSVVIVPRTTDFEDTNAFRNWSGA